MYGGLDISVSGMIAQRTRLEVIATNLANVNTTHDADGNYSPFRRRFAMFAEGDPSALNPRHRGAGVHVKDIELDKSDFRRVYDPTPPDAMPAGHPDARYIDMPNIDSPLEQVDAIDPPRAYEANVAAAEATKALVAQALRILS